MMVCTFLLNLSDFYEFYEKELRIGAERATKIIEKSGFSRLRPVRGHAPVRAMGET
jgi:hypothetical protein